MATQNHPPSALTFLGCSQKQCSTFASLRLGTCKISTWNVHTALRFHDLVHPFRTIFWVTNANWTRLLAREHLYVEERNHAKAQAERLGLMEHGSFIGWADDEELLSHLAKLKIQDE